MTDTSTGQRFIPARVYLSACYPQAADLRSHRADLEALGLIVTSTWLDMPADEDARYTRQAFATDPASCTEFAARALDDVRFSDTLVIFTADADHPCRGGSRHVEFGVALGVSARVYVCGPRENIFHTAGGVRQFNDWPALLAEFTALYGDRALTERRDVGPVPAT